MGGGRNFRREEKMTKTRGAFTTGHRMMTHPCPRLFFASLLTFQLSTSKSGNKTKQKWRNRRRRRRRKKWNVCLGKTPTHRRSVTHLEAALRLSFGYFRSMWTPNIVKIQTISGCLSVCFFLLYLFCLFFILTTTAIIIIIIIIIIFHSVRLNCFFPGDRFVPAFFFLDPVVLSENENAKPHVQGFMWPAGAEGQGGRGIAQK